MPSKQEVTLLKTMIQEVIKSELPKAACVLIVSDDGKILAVSRKNDPTDFGMPGGKTDPGESNLQAAARELQEETGLIATNLKEVFVDNDGEYETHTFMGEISGAIDTPESGVIRWVAPKVLVSGMFGDYNRRLFSKLGIKYLRNTKWWSRGQWLRLMVRKGQTLATWVVKTRYAGSNPARFTSSEHVRHRQLRFSARRYDNKVHKTQEIIEWCRDTIPDIPDVGLTPFAVAISNPSYHDSDPVTSYRAYYIGDKSRFAKWAPRAKPPAWWPFSEDE